MEDKVFEKIERQITGQSWKDCAICGEVRIYADWNPPWCQDCGGARVNCIHCDTGRDWWGRLDDVYLCPVCKKNPLIKFGEEDLLECFGIETIADEVISKTKNDR